jgi:hypothetical protein
MDGLKEYSEWSKANAGKYWIPDEPLTHDFPTSPWEGEFSYTSNGDYVQYRNGEWVEVKSSIANMVANHARPPSRSQP